MSTPAGDIHLKDFKDIKKILVLKLRHIGDVLLTVPAVRALRESFPHARISVLVNAGTEDMLTLNPVLDEVITFDRSIKSGPRARLAGELSFAGKLRRERFDMTVDLTGGDRPAIAGLLAGARCRLGYDPAGKGFKGKRYLYTHMAPRPVGRLHTVLKDLGLVRAFGIDTKDLTVDIYSTKDDDDYIVDVLSENGLRGQRPFVHVHPLSRWLFKCWTDTAMAAVMDRLMDEGLGVVVTAGPDERELKKARSIIGLMKNNPVDLSGALSLKQMASLSRRALLFFGVDSAPMHIAAATGAPVVALFGPSGAFDWGPWDNEAAGKLTKAGDGGGKDVSPYPLRNGVQRFGKNTVVQLDWECIPCGKDGCKGTKKSDCLISMEHEAVWKILRDAAGRRLKGKAGVLRGSVETGVKNAGKARK